jgi:hypothetical protein
MKKLLIVVVVVAIAACLVWNVASAATLSAIGNNGNFVTALENKVDVAVDSNQPLADSSGTLITDPDYFAAKQNVEFSLADDTGATTLVNILPIGRDSSVFQMWAYSLADSKWYDVNTVGFGYPDGVPLDLAVQIPSTKLYILSTQGGIFPTNIVLAAVGGSTIAQASVDVSVTAPDTTAPMVSSYTLNGSEENVVFNPNDPASVSIVINANESVKFNRIKILNSSGTEVKFFTESANFVTTATKTWDGKNASGTVVPDGVYTLQVNIKDEADNVNNSLDLSPHTITVDTNVEPDGGDEEGEEDEDNTPPVITLHGDMSMSAFNANGFTDPGATASDDVDASVSVAVSGSVNASTPGTYTLTYTAVDSAGNEAAPVNRNVRILASGGGGGSTGGQVLGAFTEAQPAGQVLGLFNVLPPSKGYQIAFLENQITTLMQELVALLQTQVAAAIKAQGN